MTPVLVTDALLRKSLAAVRSLGSKGVPVHAAESTRLSPGGFSRYCRESWRSPSPGDSLEAYSEWLVQMAERLPPCVLLPMDDLTTSAVYGRLDELSCLYRTLLPPETSYRQASDKYETIRLAQSLGMDCPMTRMPDDAGGLDALTEMEYPLVIKPRSSSGSRGIKIVRSKAELLAQYGATHEAFPYPLLQECIPPGERYDAALLFDARGDLKASFVQREVRHYPADIGPSTVQESVWMPELVEQAAHMLRKLEWRGIAEVEWMRDPRDGKLKLMEINPRYWNSLHLAVQSGVDFPYMHYRLAQGIEVESCHTYAVGQMTRNLLPGDLLYALSAKSARPLNPPLLSKKGRPIEDDILSWKDPMAAVGFAGACLRYLFDRKMWSMLFNR